MQNIISIVIASIFIFTFHTSYGQNSREKLERIKLDSIDGVYIPKDLEDCFVQIDYMLSDSLKVEFKNISEDKFVGITHLGLGIWMRNNWGLWGGSRLSKYFNDKEIFHPDDMSGIILTSYHRKLTAKNIDLDGQISYNKIYLEVAKEPNKKEYPKGVKRLKFDTKQHYELTENGLPGVLHIQTNSKNENTWIYDYHFGWKEIDKNDLKRLTKTSYQNRAETIKEIYNKK